MLIMWNMLKNHFLLRLLLGGGVGVGVGVVVGVVAGVIVAVSV